MSTANFPYENMLIVLDQIEDDDYEITRDLLQADFLELEGAYDATHRPNTEGFVLCTFDIARKTQEFGLELYKTVYVLLRAGYYEGYYLDYVIEDGEIFPVKTVNLDKELEKVCGRIKRLAKKYGIEYRGVATFSNGEAIYEPKK